jgi:hypothetical protein
MNNPRLALIDNSTLSAVERLLALTETRNLYNIDHDIACFEKLVHTILFYDEIYLVDDYKEYFRERRKEVFSFIKIADLSETEYRGASKEAADFAAKRPFEMEKGEPVGDTLKFFENLLLRPQLRWDVFVSSEYLTLSYLVRTKAKAALSDRLLLHMETNLPTPAGL